MKDMSIVAPNHAVDPQGEYAQRKKLFATEDRSFDIKDGAGRMPVVTPAKQLEQKVRTDIRYRSTPAKRRKAGLAPEYM